METEYSIKGIARAGGAGLAGGIIVVTLLLAGLGFFQGFTNWRIGLISPQGGDCVYRNTAVAGAETAQGGTPVVHASQITWGYIGNDGPHTHFAGHLWVGPKIDIPVSPAMVRDYFSFRAEPSLIRTIASLRRGPAWSWTPINMANVVKSVASYEGDYLREYTEDMRVGTLCFWTVREGDST